MNYILKNIGFIRFLLYLIVSSSIICCSDSNIVDVEENPFSNGVVGYTKINYKYMSTAPYHTQTSMLTGYQDKV